MCDPHKYWGVKRKIAFNRTSNKISCGVNEIYHDLISFTKFLVWTHYSVVMSSKAISPHINQRRNVNYNCSDREGYQIRSVSNRNNGVRILETVLLLLFFPSSSSRNDGTDFSHSLSFSYPSLPGCSPNYFQSLNKTDASNFLLVDQHWCVLVLRSLKGHNLWVRPSFSNNVLFVLLG